MTMGRPIATTACSLLGLGLSVWAAQAQAFTIDILHFNDFHSRIEDINAFNSTCSAEDETAGKCFGGAARLVTAINSERDAIKAQAGNVLVLNAGDVFQGSLFFTLGAGAAEVEMMNRLGLDAMVVGNHEFDLGPAPLATFIKAANFPVLTGTADVSGDTLLAPHAQPWRILEIGGKSVAILGAITPETATIASPGPTVSFGEPVATLSAATAALKAQGIDKIILLSHLGVPGDIVVAEQVPGIDAIIGGHTHTLFSNTIPGAPYKYPLMIEGPDGHTVPIVQAGAYSKYLGHLTLDFDADGVVTQATGDTRVLDASVTPDPATAARIAELAKPLEALKARRITEIPATIDGSRETCRVAECPMGDLVADAMLDRVRGQGVTIALQNGGGLRASIKGGQVTQGDVLAVLPFQNTLSTFNIKGAALVAALENGVSKVEEGGGRFPQVAGLRFSWDPSIPPGEGRIKSVEVEEKGAWVPLDPAKVYAVATNNFMRTGGDGYAVLRDEASNAYDFGPGLDEVLGTYLAANPDYPTTPQGRITKVE